MATITFQMSSTPFNGSKSFTGTDADMQNLLTWGAVSQARLIQQMFNPSNDSSFTPSNAQIAAALAQAVVNSWKNSVQAFMQQQQTPPAPMSWS